MKRTLFILAMILCSVMLSCKPQDETGGGDNSGNSGGGNDGNLMGIYNPEKKIKKISEYVIYNIDNMMIESSYEYGEPIPFIFGEKQMIPGIEEAVGYMKVGGKARIIVPSQLGFGDIKIDENLPANSTLIIDLELVDLH